MGWTHLAQVQHEPAGAHPRLSINRKNKSSRQQAAAPCPPTSHRSSTSWYASSIAMQPPWPRLGCIACAESPSSTTRPGGGMWGSDGAGGGGEGEGGLGRRRGPAQEARERPGAGPGQACTGGVGGMGGWPARLFLSGRSRDAARRAPRAGGASREQNRAMARRAAPAGRLTVGPLEHGGPLVDVAAQDLLLGRGFEQVGDCRATVAQRAVGAHGSGVCRVKQLASCKGAGRGCRDLTSGLGGPQVQRQARQGSRRAPPPWLAGWLPACLPALLPRLPTVVRPVPKDLHQPLLALAGRVCREEGHKRGACRLRQGCGQRRALAWPHQRGHQLPHHSASPHQSRSQQPRQRNAHTAPTQPPHQPRSRHTAPPAPPPRTGAVGWLLVEAVPLHLAAAHVGGHKVAAVAQEDAVADCGGGRSRGRAGGMAVGWRGGWWRSLVG